MQIHNSSSAGAATVLKLNGHLNFDGRTSFRKSIKDARAAGAKSITLNMENVSDIDSAGLALLKNAYEELNVAGISFNLSHPHGGVLKLLDLARIPAIIPIL